MSLLRFTHSSRGYIKLMQSSGVESDLKARAERIAAVARPRFSSERIYGDPVRVEVSTHIGKTRAQAGVIAIHPAAMAIERRRRILGGAIDAASG